MVGVFAVPDLAEVLLDVYSAYIGEELHSMEEQIRKSIAVMKNRYKAEKYILIT